MVRPQLYCHIGYTTTCFGPGYWPSSGCSQLIDQLAIQCAWVLFWGDEISSYNIGVGGWLGAWPCNDLDKCLNNRSVSTRPITTMFSTRL